MSSELPDEPHPIDADLAETDANSSRHLGGGLLAGAATAVDPEPRTGPEPRAFAPPEAPAAQLADLADPERNTAPEPLTERISQGMPSYAEPEPQIAGVVGREVREGGEPPGPTD